MYQLMVLGLGFLLIAGGGYYVTKTDTQGVLGLSLTNTPTFSLPTTEEISGTYVCAQDAGCSNPYTLTLIEDGTARIDISYNEGAEIVRELGTWMFEQGGFISLSLTGSALGPYDSPHTFLIQSVSSSTLQKYVYDRTQYPDMVKPVFTRQGQ